MPAPPQEFDLQTYYHVTSQQFLNRRAGNFNCHLGQRKLLFALLEFLTLCVEKFDTHLRDCLLIYIGAAPGLNISVVLQVLWLSFMTQALFNADRTMPGCIISVLQTIASKKFTHDKSS